MRSRRSGILLTVTYHFSDVFFAHIDLPDSVQGFDVSVGETSIPGETIHNEGTRASCITSFGDKLGDGAKLKVATDGCIQGVRMVRISCVEIVLWKEWKSEMWNMRYK